MLLVWYKLVGVAGGATADDDLLPLVSVCQFALWLEFLAIFGHRISDARSCVVDVPCRLHAIFGALYLLTRRCPWRRR